MLLMKLFFALNAVFPCPQRKVSVTIQKVSKTRPKIQGNGQVQKHRIRAKNQLERSH